MLFTQLGLQFLKTLQGTLQVLNDIRSQFIRGRQAIEVCEGLVLNPEQVKACLVTLQNIFYRVSAETAVRIFFRPCLCAVMTVLRVIALDEVHEVGIGHRVLFQREMDVGAEVINPHFLGLHFGTGRTFVKEDNICLYTRLVKNASWQTENGVQIRGVQQLFTDDLACTTLKQNVIRYNNGRLSGRFQNRIDMLDKVELLI